MFRHFSTFGLLIAALVSVCIYVRSAPAQDRQRDENAAVAELLARAERGDFDALEELARALLLISKYRNAVQVAEQALRVAEEKFGKDDPRYARSLNNLASCYKELGDYARAEDLSRQSLSAFQRIVGADSQEAGLVNSNLAGHLDSLGRSREARNHYELSLQILETARGRHDPIVAGILNNISEFYRGQGAIGLAVEMSERSLSILEPLHKTHATQLAINLNNLASLYREQARYDKAKTLFERGLKLSRELGSLGRRELANTQVNFALLLNILGRAPEAEALIRNSLQIRKELYGEGSLPVATGMHDLASVLNEQGKYKDAEPLLMESYDIRVRKLGPAHPEVAKSLNSITLLYRQTGRYDKVDTVLEAGKKIAEQTFSPEDPALATVLNNIAGTLSDMGRTQEAEKLFVRSLEIARKAYGNEHPAVALSLNNFATNKLARGQLVDAEAFLKESLQIREKVLGPEHSDVAIVLNNLGAVLMQQGREAEANSLITRSVVILEKAVGKEHPLFAHALGNLAVAEHAMGNWDRAISLTESSLSVRRRVLGETHPLVAVTMTNFGGLLVDAGKLDQASITYEHAKAIFEKAFGPDHTHVGEVLARQATLLERVERFADAEALRKRSLTIAGNIQGKQHPIYADRLALLSLNALAQGKVDQAFAQIGEATQILIERSQARSEAHTSIEAKRTIDHFRTYVSTASRLDRSAPARFDQTFLAAQWALRTEAEAATHQMASRFSGGSDGLARLVRERQDLVALRELTDRKLIGEFGRQPDATSAATLDLLRRQITLSTERVKQLDDQIRKDFPSYSLLTAPQPLAAADVQRFLHANEALVLFLDTPKVGKNPGRIFIWVVTTADAIWASVDRDSDQLTADVEALRCGLDETSWVSVEGDRDRPLRCQKHLGQPPPAKGVPLPFDLKRAHELYTVLFAPIEKLITGKQLLVVPSGALTTLPLHVLVTRPVSARNESTIDTARYRDVSWLGLRQAITVLPSAASLKALRELPKQRQLSNSYIGFGNPLLVGRFGTDRSAESAQQCPPVGALEQLPANAANRSLERISLPPGERPKLDHVRRQAPLPETADELCRVARTLGVRQGDLDRAVWLGQRATEKAIKDLSKSGVLAHQAIFHFATHGMVGGNLKGLGEAALVLTPPKNGRTAEELEVDDGLLTSSEVAQLQLNADWVIMSACNTAAGNFHDTEPLSGLARAFIYAGARAILATHWQVRSAAAVKLITGVFGALKDHPEIGKAEALKLSMAKVIESGQTNEIHPAYWAPFVLVGEGARDTR